MEAPPLSDWLPWIAVSLPVIALLVLVSLALGGRIRISLRKGELDLIGEEERMASQAFADDAWKRLIGALETKVADLTKELADYEDRIRVVEQKHVECEIRCKHLESRLSQLEKHSGA